MAFLVEIYSEDENFLSELADELDELVVTAEEPAPVEAPGSLDLDLASLSGQLWEFVVAFGNVKASLEAVQLLVGMLHRRKKAGVQTTVEIALGDGVRVMLTGDMTADEVAAQVEKYRDKALELSKS